MMDSNLFRDLGYVGIVSLKVFVEQLKAKSLDLQSEPKQLQNGR